MADSAPATIDSPALPTEQAKQSIADLNRAHWNSKANSYLTLPWQKYMVQLMTTFILSNLSWIGVNFKEPSSEFESSNENPVAPESVRLLDYACGPGTITAILLPYITEAVGVDISENMVLEYNRRFSTNNNESNHGAKGNIPPKAQAVVGDLISSATPAWSIENPKYDSFDLACVSFGFHHFDNLPLCTSRLVQRLKPNGVFMITDFLDENPSAPHDRHRDHHHHHDHHDDHQAHHRGDHNDDRYIARDDDESVDATITYPHGFTRKQVEELFGGAGLTNIKVEVLDGVVKMERTRNGKTVVMDRKVFVAVGRKE